MLFIFFLNYEFRSLHVVKKTFVLILSKKRVGKCFIEET